MKSGVSSVDVMSAELFFFVYCHEGEFDSYLDIYRKATA